MSPSLQREPLSVSKSVFRWIDNQIPWLQHLGWSTLLVVVLSMVTGTPDIRRFLHWQPTPAERALDWKIHHPLSPTPAAEFVQPSDATHLLKRTYRITLPIAAYYLGLNIREAVILSALCALAFSFTMLWHSRRLFPA